jgi:hypothetical protein
VPDLAQIVGQMGRSQRRHPNTSEHSSTLEQLGVEIISWERVRSLLILNRVSTPASEIPGLESC